MSTRSRPPVPLMSWDTIKDIVDSGDLAPLGRSDTQQAVYDDFRSRLNSEWESVSDFVLATKFDIHAEINPSTGKKAARRDEICEDKIVMHRNDFPYHFESGVNHFLIWKIGSQLTAEDVENCVREIWNNTANVKDVITYVNPPHLKSIPDIDHAHILYCL
jgi:hypothetical protein